MGANTRHEVYTTLTSEMYWFLVWSFVAVFSYNYDAADANVWVTPDEIERRDLITDDGDC